jgi:hypothetical protein
MTDIEIKNNDIVMNKIEGEKIQEIKEIIKTVEAGKENEQPSIFKDNDIIKEVNYITGDVVVENKGVLNELNVADGIRHEIPKKKRNRKVPGRSKADQQIYGKEKIMCECGRKIRRSQISIHRKKKIHLNHKSLVNEQVTNIINNTITNLQNLVKKN